MYLFRRHASRSPGGAERGQKQIRSRSHGSIFSKSCGPRCKFCLEVRVFCQPLHAETKAITSASLLVICIDRYIGLSFLLLMLILHCDILTCTLLISRATCSGPWCPAIFCLMTSLTTITAHVGFFGAFTPYVNTESTCASTVLSISQAFAKLFLWRAQLFAIRISCFRSRKG